MDATLKKNDLVRIGNNRKVYRVQTAPCPDTGGRCYLEADADHPDAAKRVPDAFRWYEPAELTKVDRLP